MRNSVLLSLALLAALLSSCSDDSTSPTDTGDVTFSRMIGSPGSDTNTRGVVVTSDGLRVVVGMFTGTLRVTGSSDSLVATDASDVFLTAFRADGTLAWKRVIGGDGLLTFPSSIARDANDNFYVAGVYQGDTAFGTIPLTGYGSFDVLVAKLDAAGDPIWAVGGGATGDDRAHDVAVAADGGAFVCGDASSEIIVAGEDMGEFGSLSGFLIKINANGVGGWTATAYGTGAAYCLALARSGDGVIVTGFYSGSAVEIGGETLPLDGTQGAFISRFTASGGSDGNIRIGGAGSCTPHALTEIDGEPVVAGAFTGIVDFDVNTAAGERTSSGLDAFIARYSSDGALRWVRTYGTADEEQATSVSRLGSSDLLLGGLFESYITLGSTTLPTNGTNDIFIARLDSGGNVLSASRLGGPNYEHTVSVTSAGETAIALGQGWGDIRFPDGTHRSSFGTLDGLLYQQP